MWWHLIRLAAGSALLNQKEIRQKIKEYPERKRLEEQRQAEEIARVELELQRTLEEAVRLVDTLKSSFHFQKDRFDDFGFCLHSSLEGKETRIDVLVRSDGEYYLRSIYIGEEELSHEGIDVIVGAGSTIHGPRIAPDDKCIERRISDSLIEEWVVYEHGSDNGIVSAIAGAANGLGVSVRLEGKAKAYLDLNPNQIRGFRESFIFARALKILHERHIDSLKYWTQS